MLIRCGITTGWKLDSALILIFDPG